MKTRSNMPLFVLEVSDVKALSNSQIDLLRCGDWLVKKDASGEHPYQVTFKKEGVGMCLTYHDASVIETQSYDWNNSLKKWVYNSEDKTENLLDVATKDDIESGDVDLPLESIKDADGHLRFIEGDINLNDGITSITKKYGKWSLSGSHLLIVFAFSIAEDGVLSAGYIADVNIPQWVLDKIYPLFGNNIDYKSFYAFASGGDNSQSVGVYLDKDTDKLQLYNTGLVANTDRSCRIAFDLLIDNE